MGQKVSPIGLRVGVIRDWVRYRQETGDERPCVVASTASPYKFAPAVLPAVSEGPYPADEFDMLEKLHEVTHTPVPVPLAGLRGRRILHGDCIEKQEMESFIRRVLE